MDRDFLLGKMARTCLTLAGLGLFTLCLVRTGFSQGAIDQLPYSPIYVPPASPPTPPPEDNGSREEPAQPEPPRMSPEQRAAQKAKVQAPVWTEFFNLGYVSQGKLGFKLPPRFTTNAAVPVQPAVHAKGPVSRAEGAEISVMAKKVAREFGLPKQLHDLPHNGKLTPEEWRAWFDDSRVHYSMNTELLKNSLDKYHICESGIGTANGKSYSDCSHFVFGVLYREGLRIPYCTTHELMGSPGHRNPHFVEVSPGEARPGDVILASGVAQKYENGNPLKRPLDPKLKIAYEDKDAHMGIYQGKNLGTQMGKSGHATTLSWGTSENSYTGGILAKEIHYYRPIRE